MYISIIRFFDSKVSFWHFELSFWNFEYFPLTRELVYANIALVMETDRKKITEENLIRCGREEFLEKGYAGANLRDICKRAGVTTGAFYFSFENKEALLGAILDPLIAEYQKMMQKIAIREQEHPETAEQNEREIMEYICAHSLSGLL